MDGVSPPPTPPPCVGFSSPPFTVMSSSPSASTCFISSPTISPDLYGVSTYCVTDGTRGYSSNEWCNIRIDQNVTLHRAFFEVESGFDWIALYAPGVTVPASRPYSAPSFAWSDNRHPPVWVNASEGSRLIWSTDTYSARGGFELCAVPHCAVPQSTTSRPPPSPPPCEPTAKEAREQAGNFSLLFLSPIFVVMLILCTIHLNQLHIRRKARLQLRRRIASHARQISAPSLARHAGRADVVPARGVPAAARAVSARGVPAAARAVPVRGVPVADATAVVVQMGVPAAARDVGLGVEPSDIHGNQWQSAAISGVEERRVGLDFYVEPVFGIPVTALSGRSQDNQRQSPVYGQPVSAVSSAFAVPAPYATAGSAASSASPAGITPGIHVAHDTVITVV